MTFGALRCFSVTALRRRALTGWPPALERLFIASARSSEGGIVAGDSSTGHGMARGRPSGQRYAYASLTWSRAGAASTGRPDGKRIPAAFQGRFSPLLEAEYLSEVR